MEGSFMRQAPLLTTIYREYCRGEAAVGKQLLEEGWNCSGVLERRLVLLKRIRVYSDRLTCVLMDKVRSTEAIDRVKGEGVRSIFIIANQLRGFSPRANYTDQATAACRRS
jgi:hypothetical protein